MRKRVLTLANFITLMLALLITMTLGNMGRPASWSMPMEAAVSRFELAGVNEQTDDLVLARTYDSGDRLKPDALSTELAVYSLSSGKAKQKHFIPDHERSVNVVINANEFICNSTGTGFLWIVDRTTGSAKNLSSKQPSTSFASSPTGKYIFRQSSREWSVRPASGDADEWTTIGKHSGEVCPIGFSPDGSTLFYWITDKMNIWLGVLDLEHDINPEWLVTDSAIELSTSMKVFWLGVDQAVVVIHYLESAKTEQQNPTPRTSSFHVHLGSGIIAVNEPNDKELAFASHFNEHFSYEHVFANGTRIVSWTKPVNPMVEQFSAFLWNNDHKFLARSLRMPTRYLGKVITAVHLRPIYSRSYVRDEWTSSLQSIFERSPVSSNERREFFASETPFCSTHDFVQPSFFGSIRDHHLEVFRLEPLLPNWLFQLIVFLGTCAILCVIRVLWLGFRSLIRKQTKGTSHA